MPEHGLLALSTSKRIEDPALRFAIDEVCAVVLAMQTDELRPISASTVRSR